MNRFAAALFALSVMQKEAAAPTGPAEPPEPAPPVMAEPPAAPSAPPARPPEPASAPPPAVAPVRPGRTGEAAVPEAPRAPPPAAAAPEASVSVPVPQRLPHAAAPVAPPRSDRERALRAALSFLDALLHGDALALASASTARFSFDGDLVDGRDAQARRWRELFARRPAGGGALRDLVLMPAPEAVAQLGPPPASIAGLPGPATWVAVANVSERPVVLFVARDGDRWAVAGMHD